MAGNGHTSPAALLAVPKGMPAKFKSKPAKALSTRGEIAAAPANNEPKRRRRSESASLKHLPTDWRQRIDTTMEPDLRVLWLM
jgi:hypothetical protein